MKTHIRLINMVVLIIILIGGAYLFISVQGSPPMQFGSGALTAISYAIWGILYHSALKDLHLKVVIEYVLISLIAIILLFIMLFS